VAGIYYDRRAHRLRAVPGAADPEWTFITHNVAAGRHQCRRIMGEWLSPEELASIDWSALERRIA
jgi:hypothetical protein